MTKNLKNTEINPVSKVQEIVKTLTEDERLQNKLLEILTRNLTIEQIDKIYAAKENTSI